VLELVEGPTLADRLAAGPLALTEALSIARQIAEALAAAHDKGIVHRDLKPANVKITPQGVVKVLDFGIAKPSAGDNVNFDTREGVILGTAAYMSPEQTRGQSVDARTDIWAFGCVLYEMLTGQTPFAGKTAVDTMAAIVGREPDWTRIPPAVPPSLERRFLHADRRFAQIDSREGSQSRHFLVRGQRHVLRRSRDLYLSYDNVLGPDTADRTGRRGLAVD